MRPNLINFVDVKTNTGTLHKQFLWGGVPKIAHRTLIANYEYGGIGYRDLNEFISSMNVKFIQNLPLVSETSHTVLPILWIKQLFKISTGDTGDYFSTCLNILDCKYKTPRKAFYRGHPFYFAILKRIENVSTKLCKNTENILAIPIWYNRYLQTKFDSEISQAGFNFIKDLFPNNSALVNFGNLAHVKIRKLQRLINMIPQNWRDQVLHCQVSNYVTIEPCQKVNLNGLDIPFKKLSVEVLYRQSILPKLRLPTGFLRWQEQFYFSDAEIKTAFTFAKYCSDNVFNQDFQYKILTKILPTQKYLHRYEVAATDICPRCHTVQDTVLHNLWLCPRIVPYLVKVIRFLRFDCNIKEIITPKSYLFGFRNSAGLNHILLEFKKELFYNWDSRLAAGVFCEQFISKIRRIIIKEKHIATENGRTEKFTKKWTSFLAIYNFHGPDPQSVFKNLIFSSRGGNFQGCL